MKIKFYKGCYSRSLTFKSNEKELWLSDDVDDYDNTCEKNWENNLEQIKNLLIFLLEKLDLNDKQYMYVNYISHDYENEVTKTSNEITEALNNYISNIKFKKMRSDFDEPNDNDKIISNDESYKDVSDLMNMVIEFVEFFKNETPDDGDSCDQCGDYNYTHTVSVDFDILNS